MSDEMPDTPSEFLERADQICDDLSAEQARSLMVVYLENLNTALDTRKDDWTAYSLEKQQEDNPWWGQ